MKENQTPEPPRKKEENEKTKAASFDPPEEMKGPFSSLMHKAGHTFETEETKKEADKRHEERW